MVRSFGDSGAVATLMVCGEEIARGEEAVGWLAAGRSRRESMAWRGGRMSNVEGVGRARLGDVWGIPAGFGSAEGMV